LADQHRDPLRDSISVSLLDEGDQLLRVLLRGGLFGQSIGRRTSDSWCEPTLDFHLRLCAFDQWWTPSKL